MQFHRNVVAVDKFTKAISGSYAAGCFFQHAHSDSLFPSQLFLVHEKAAASFVSDKNYGSGELGFSALLLTNGANTIANVIALAKFFQNGVFHLFYFVWETLSAEFISEVIKQICLLSQISLSCVTAKICVS